MSADKVQMFDDGTTLADILRNHRLMLEARRRSREWMKAHYIPKDKRKPDEGRYGEKIEPKNEKKNKS